MDKPPEKKVKRNKKVTSVSPPPRPDFLDKTYAQFIFPEGSLSDAVLQSVALQETLTSEEEANIVEAKKILTAISKKLGNNKIIYRKMLNAQSNKYIHLAVTIEKTSSGVQRLATLADMKTICVKQQKKAQEYIKYLFERAQKLFTVRQFERSKSECKTVLDYSIQVNGPNNIHTLDIQLHYGLIQGSSGNKETGKALIELTVKKLEPELIAQPSNKIIKKLIAYANYWLAQYYYDNDDFNAATSHLDRSEHLRKEYGASKKELDKIRFLRGKIAYANGRNPEALKILMQCYDFRRSENELNSHLLPVLETLIEIKHEQGNPGAELWFFTQLLDIQKHIPVDEKQIVVTQLRILTLMSMRVHSKEYWTVMNDVIKRLKKISIREESVEVGMLHMQFASTRMSRLLPHKWSCIKKQGYYSETLKLIAKAELHLIRSAANPNDRIISAKKHLAKLKRDCLMIIDHFDDPTKIGFIGEPLHPEDEEAMLLIPQNDGVSESSTPKVLMALSDFSSEARHSLVDVSDRLLTAAEFELLAKEGHINPLKLRTAQGGVNQKFRDGKSLKDTKQLLTNNPNCTEEIPPIEIGIYEGKVYSFDTRRLIVHQQAKEENPDVMIRYKKISGEYLQQRVEAIFSPRPWNGIVTALRYGGKNSNSEPYINPSLRSQLEKKVSKKFKRFPNDRYGADANGFPIIEKKARKIYDFLRKKAKNGSAFSKNILKEVNQIFDSRGEDAAYAFLIKKKSEIPLLKSQNKQSLKQGLNVPLLNFSSTLKAMQDTEGTASYTAQGKSKFNSKKDSLDSGHGKVVSKQQLDQLANCLNSQNIVLSNVPVQNEDGEVMLSFLTIEGFREAINILSTIFGPAMGNNKWRLLADDEQIHLSVDHLQDFSNSFSKIQYST